MVRCPTTLLLMLVALPAAAGAQPLEAPTAAALFGDGKAVTYRFEEMDHRFERSQFARGLARGSSSDACAKLLTGMLAVLADAAPSLQRRDENFTADPGLVRALSTQLTTPHFPGNAYLAAMIRRVMLDQKLPPDWLKLAEQLDPSGQTIDLARLKFLADGVKPIDSLYFTFPILLQRYEIEVKRANSAAAPTAMRDFREAYLDHEVAWSGLSVIDIGPDKHKRDAARGMVARLEIRPTDPYENVPWAVFLHHRKPRPWRFTVHLQPNQYVDLARIPKGTKVMVRGRLYDFDRGLTGFELRGGLLFLDRAGASVQLATPAEVERCPLALDELHGVAPSQPGGFGMH